MVAYEGTLEAKKASIFDTKEGGGKKKVNHEPFCLVKVSLDEECLALKWPRMIVLDSVETNVKRSLERDVLGG